MFRYFSAEQSLRIMGKGTECADQEAFHVLFPFAEKLTFYMYLVSEKKTSQHHRNRAMLE